MHVLLGHPGREEESEWDVIHAAWSDHQRNNHRGVLLWYSIFALTVLEALYAAFHFADSRYVNAMNVACYDGSHPY
jgi:hypothetical protein